MRKIPVNIIIVAILEITAMSCLPQESVCGREGWLQKGKGLDTEFWLGLGFVVAALLCVLQPAAGLWFSLLTTVVTLVFHRAL